MAAKNKKTATSSSLLASAPHAVVNVFKDIELPCDWTVNRRPVVSSLLQVNHHNHNHHHGAAASNECGSNDANENNNNNNGGGGGSSSNNRHAEQSHAANNKKGDGHDIIHAPQAINSGSCGGKLSKSTCYDESTELHPLGPMSIAMERVMMPTASASESTEQVKRLVLKHLSSCTDSKNNTAGTSMTCVEEDPDSSKSNSGSGGNEGRAEECVIDTEGLLSRLPYKKMLCDMFGGCLKGNLQNLPIPYVSRAYEEAFMREPMHSSERECAKGKLCECMFIDRSQPFVAVEFLLPGEQLPRTPHLCVLCCRSTTQQLYYDIMIDKMDFPGTIQRFGNIHSQPGEYSLDAMLIAVPSAPVHILPLPIVSHQRNRYIVYVTSGIKRLKQSRVYFQSTPSCSADSGM